MQPLPLKSGALQGAVAIEYPFEHHFQNLHIVYDGVNGQLPNLDLFNTAVAIAGGQMGIGTHLQEMWDHNNSYEARLQTILRGMTKQGLGYATGAHSSFMPYHIDAITLQPKGHGYEDEMALGRTIESICRSLNNLLEHLHQSFFFYLLMHTNRFVSIGTYLPSAMLIAGNFTIMAIALWMRTGYYADSKPSTATSKSKDEKQKQPGKEEKIMGSAVAERLMALPLTLVSGLHLLGLVPLWMFNNLHHQVNPKQTLALTQPRDTDNAIALHNSNLHHHRRRSIPPTNPRRLPLDRTRPLQPNHPPAIPPRQILRPPPSRPLTIHPRNPQLLPILHDRPPLCASDFRHPSPNSPSSCTNHYHRSGLGGPQSSFAAARFARCLLVYGCVGGVCFDAGCIRVGCLGDVDAGCGLVCLVAGLVDWVYSIGVVYVLIRVEYRIILRTYTRTTDRS